VSGGILYGHGTGAALRHRAGRVPEALGDLRRRGRCVDTEEAFHGRFHGLGGSSVALFIAATTAQHEMATVAQRSCPISASPVAS